MRRARSWTPERIEEARQYRKDNNATLGELSKHFKCSKSYISTLLNKPKKYKITKGKTPTSIAIEIPDARPVGSVAIVIAQPGQIKGILEQLW